MNPLPPAPTPSPATAIEDLPAHIIVSPVGSEFQVRALATLNEHSQADFEATAVSIAEAYSRSSLHVTFFDSEDRLVPSSVIDDADRPHWLCDVDVDTNVKGRLYASSFHRAPNADAPADDHKAEPDG